MASIATAAEAKPGHLYAEVFTVQTNDGNEYDRYDRLLYRGSDGKWYDGEAEDGEIVERKSSPDCWMEQDAPVDSFYANMKPDCSIMDIDGEDTLVQHTEYNGQPILKRIVRNDA